MVSIEISTIIYSSVGILILVVGYLLNRTLTRIEERFLNIELSLKEYGEDLARLCGEHEAIKEQCMKPKRKR